MSRNVTRMVNHAVLQAKNQVPVGNNAVRPGWNFRDRIPLDWPYVYVALSIRFLRRRDVKKPLILQSGASCRI